MKESEQGPKTFDAVAVGAMALHDRAFFEYLLKSPREAMLAKASEFHLTVTDADIAMVEALISARKATKDPLKLWDRWKETGFWEPGDWTQLWVPIVIPPHGPGPQG